MNKLNYILIGLFLIAGCLFEVQGQAKDTIVKEEPIFAVAEVMPEYPGGIEVRQKFLRDNIKYPKLEKNVAITSKVIIKFVVEKDGSITDIQVVRSISPAFDEEIVRVIKLMPKWESAKQKGCPVRAFVILPVDIDLK